MLEKCSRPRSSKLNTTSTSACVRFTERTRRQGPPPWIKRKGVVVLVWAIHLWNYYVFVARVAVKMVRMDPDALGSRSQGIAYLVIFHVLFLLWAWSYLKVTTTPPGYAHDCVPQTDLPIRITPRPRFEYAGPRYSDLPPAPIPVSSPPRVPHSSDSSDGTEAGGIPLKEMGRSDHKLPGVEGKEGSAPALGELTEPRGAERGDDTIAPTPYPNAPNSISVHAPSSSGTTLVSTSVTIPHPAAPAAAHLPSSIPPSAPPPPLPTPTHKKSISNPLSFLHFPPPPEGYQSAPVRPVVERPPPDDRELLTEFYRYDYELGLVRPFRSHKCRECNTVVLRMDHHCPWIGMCVGARNYKYFYNMVFWASLFGLFNFLALLICNALPHSPRPPVDGQQMAIIFISFVLTFFTFALLVLHTILILQNCTTIEQFRFQTVRRKDKEALSQQFGFWNFRAKRDVKRQWRAEWGKLMTEGNLWWKGSRKANWVEVLGESPWGWFLPIPAKPIHDDGLSYVPNPRFSPEGVWRPRREWPVELR